MIKHAIKTKLFIRAFIIIFLISVLSIFWSHRIAGPLYRMRIILKDICEGKKVKEVRFRKSDEFKELAEDLNKLVEKLGMKE